jgi:hypothetical protein
MGVFGERRGDEQLAHDRPGIIWLFDIGRCSFGHIAEREHPVPLISI